MPDYGGYTLDELANAFMQVESSGGKNARRRFEPGFLKRYLSKTLEPDFEALAKKYGREAMATSYGPFQVIYRTAYEHGFRGSPEELESPTVNRKYFEKKFLSDYKKTGNLDAAILRYNGGGNPNYVNLVKQHLRKTPIFQKPIQPTQASVQKTGARQMPDDDVERKLFHMDKLIRRVFGTELSPMELSQVAGKLKQAKPKPQSFPTPEMLGQEAFNGQN